jgi:hypothetical protein
MTVNPNLAELMCVIEDNQDKMSEGQYLKAMNALGALHKEAIRTSVVLDASAPELSPPPSYDESLNLFANHHMQPPIEFQDINEDDRLAWYCVKDLLPEYREITPNEWITMSEEERSQLYRQSIDIMVSAYENKARNPDPKICPFIARHSVGPWRFGNEQSQWTCVCGYTGKSKHWRKHEESERHQDWAKHRTVSRRAIEKMKMYIEQDEIGHFIRYKPNSIDCFSGVRYFLVHQEKNEWTHPELFVPLNILTKSNFGLWFYHRREYWARNYVQ